jgi:hypothetical protein
MNLRAVNTRTSCALIASVISLPISYDSLWVLVGHANEILGNDKGKRKTAP